MNWEEAVVSWANDLAGRSATLDWVMFQLADGRLWIIPLVAVLGWWLWKGRTRAAITMLTLAAGIGIGDFIGGRLKVAFGRPRPCRILDTWNDVAGCGGAFSMPSNHMVNSALAASFLQVLFPRSGWITWPLVALNAFARMFSAAHYPTDIVAGLLIGGGIGTCLALALRYWRGRASSARLAPQD